MSLLQDAKAVVELAHQMGNMDLYKRLVELQGQVVELAQRNLELEQELAEITKAGDLGAKLQIREDAYWLPRDGQQPDGPFCMTCWDVDNKLVRMKRLANNRLLCLYCQHHRGAGRG
jgi:hypothetical protein